MRILITGSRSWSNVNVVRRGLTVAIEQLTKAFPDDREIIVVHGGAKGADTMASDYVIHARKYLASKGYTIKEEVHYPDYTKFPGRVAPLERNTLMVNLGADLCVAFNRANSSGTANTIKKAQAAGIEVLEFKSA